MVRTSVIFLGGTTGGLIASDEVDVVFLTGDGSTAIGLGLRAAGSTESGSTVLSSTEAGSTKVSSVGTGSTEANSAWTDSTTAGSAGAVVDGVIWMSGTPAGGADGFGPSTAGFDVCGGRFLRKN